MLFAQDDRERAELSCDFLKSWKNYNQNRLNLLIGWFSHNIHKMCQTCWTGHGLYQINAFSEPWSHSNLLD